MPNHKYRGYDIIKSSRISPYTGKPEWEIPAEEDFQSRYQDTLADARARIDRIIKEEAAWKAQRPVILDGLAQMLVRSK
ncbi:hypothetical protein IQ16_03723 [Bradyrhizobium huanghuaihaiense]|uniref:Uncharacterized protein n=1 Tax=Bradyrhizobium huanghuaihaiense TaxID=990078 RepID=A0A562RQE0_9BRAD|nr:hypothetical protein [Bradyrhizobium huanghuaihaiense]TWI70550.1 hypothetical protein IQ16_03723 [Bradyrhizobium huanghuaihaiense]